MFGELQMTEDESLRLRKAFKHRWGLLRTAEGDLFPWNVRLEVWHNYLESIQDVEYVSNLAEPIDYLLDVINRGDFNRYVIRCPVQDQNFIILTKEAADKVLAIGLP